MEDLQSASKLLSKAMKIRERYMKMSQQRFPTLAESYLRGAKGFPEEGPNQPNKATIEGKYDFRNKSSRKRSEKEFFSWYCTLSEKQQAISSQTSMVNAKPDIFDMLMLLYMCI